MSTKLSKGVLLGIIELDRQYTGERSRNMEKAALWAAKTYNQNFGVIPTTSGNKRIGHIDMVRFDD